MIAVASSGIWAKQMEFSQNFKVSCQDLVVFYCHFSLVLCSFCFLFF